MTPIAGEREAHGVKQRLMKMAREVGGLTWADRKCIGEAIALIDRAALLEPVGEGWQPIETAPQGREMFVVKAFNVRNGFTGGKPYTSDPWCVWQDEPGKFARWPHNFAPTHWHALAASPKSNGGMGS